MEVSKNPPNSVSVSYAMIFLRILNSTCTGQFYGGIAVIGLLLMDVVQGKHIHLLCCVPTVLIYRMHLNRYVGSFCFLYILSFILYVMRCNSRTVYFYFFSVAVFLCTAARESISLNIVGSTDIS